MAWSLLPTHYVALGKVGSFSKPVNRGADCLPSPQSCRRSSPWRPCGTDWFSKLCATSPGAPSQTASPCLP